MQLVTVKFGTDKRAAKSYESFYGGSRPNRSSTYNYLWDTGDVIAGVGVISVGDYVVVHTPSHGLTVVEVVAVDNYPQVSPEAYKWVVDVVDFRAYEAKERQRLERRRIEAERRRQDALLKMEFDNRIKSAKAVINNKINEAREQMVMQKVLEANPDIKELMDRLARLEAERESLDNT